MKTATFRGRKWNIRAATQKVLGKDVVGICEPPAEKDKTILLHHKLRGLEGLDTAIHEALHACCWSMEEKDVEETATDIARFLWRLGYRQVEA